MAMATPHRLYCLHCGQAVEVGGIIPAQCPICLKAADRNGEGKGRGTWWSKMPRFESPEDVDNFDREFLKKLRITPG